MTGKAKIKWPSKFKIYEGDVVDGKRHGYGTTEHVNRSGKTLKKHEGNWVDDHSHGDGKIWNHG